MQVDGFALDKLDGLLAEEAGDDEFFYFWRGGDDGGKCGGGIGADGDGDLQASAIWSANGEIRQWQSSTAQASRGLEWGTVCGGRQGGAAGGFCHDGDASGGCGVGFGRGAGGCFGGLAEAFTIMFGGNFLALPVHAGGLAVVDLHAIHADVALPCRRCAGRG